MSSRSHRLIRSVVLPLLVAACDRDPPTAPTPSAASIIIEVGDTSVSAGFTFVAAATVLDANGSEISTSHIWWRSSAANVIAVDNSGYARALAVGSAWLTAGSGAIADSVRVHVTPAPLTPLGIRPVHEAGTSDAQRIFQQPFPVIGGIGLQLAAYTVMPNDTFVGYDGPRTWHSTDESVFTIDSLGFVRAVSMGIAAVVVSAPGLMPDTVAIAAVPGYTVLDLGFAAEAINDVGQVVGNRGDDPLAGGEAVIWQEGVVAVLDSFVATDINNHGAVTGRRLVDGRIISTVWRDGTFHDLPSGGRGAVGYAINDAGVVVGAVGCAFSGSGKFAYFGCDTPARWVDGQLDTLPDHWGVMVDVDPNGYAVGIYSFAGDGPGIDNLAVVWAPDGSITRLDGIEVYDRNAAGWTVGVAGNWQAAAWSPSGVRAFYTKVGVPTSRMTAINEAGVMVGNFDDVSQRWPFVLHPGFPPISLLPYMQNDVSDPLEPADVAEDGRIVVKNLLLTPGVF